MHIIREGWSSSVSLHPLVTAELTADWKVSAPPIEKMSRRNQITASTRVDGTTVDGFNPVFSRTWEKEKAVCEDRHGAFVSRAIKWYWSSLPSGKIVSSDSLEMKTTSFLCRRCFQRSSLRLCSRRASTRRCCRGYYEIYKKQERRCEL